MRSLKNTCTAILLAGAAGTCRAEVNFTEFSVTQISTVENLRMAAGTADTSAILGVAVYPATDGPVYTIHTDSQQRESFLQVQPAEDQVYKLTDSVRLATELGPPYTTELRLSAGLAYSTWDNRLYIAEDFHGDSGDLSLIGVNVSTGVPALVMRSSTIGGLTDFAVMPDGKIASARSTGTDRTVGIINPVAKTWNQRFTDSDFHAVATGHSELVPDVVGASAGANAVYLFCQGGMELFRVPAISDQSPVIQRITEPAFSATNIQDITLDQDGNLYAYDSIAHRLLVVRNGDDSVFSIPLTEIEAELGAAAQLVPRPRNGLAARTAGRGRTDLFIAPSTLDHSIIQVRFGAGLSAVADWELY